MNMCKTLLKFLVVISSLFMGQAHAKMYALPSSSPQEFFSDLLKAHQREDWRELVLASKDVLEVYPHTNFADEAQYYLGVGFFHREEYDQANMAFSNYLKNSTNPKFFEEALSYKFKIADLLRNGQRIRLFQGKKSPKWLLARSYALEIYDEVITSMPYHDLAAKALYGKALLQQRFESYKDGIETLQTLLKRFPKNALAIDAYVLIGKLHLDLCQDQQLDPDLLDRARENHKKFLKAFPGTDRVIESEKSLLSMEEVFAEDLQDIGQFFERTGKPNAALIYYSKIVKQYPNTKAAAYSSRRVELLKETS